jgi:hypothetical protein
MGKYSGGNIERSVENFFEANEVGMDAVSHLKDEEITEISLYDLLGWYTVDSFFSLPTLGRKEETVAQPSGLTEEYNFTNSMYWSWGGRFSYDVPVSFFLHVL